MQSILRRSSVTILEEKDLQKKTRERIRRGRSKKRTLAHKSHQAVSDMLKGRPKILMIISATVLIGVAIALSVTFTTGGGSAKSPPYEAEAPQTGDEYPDGYEILGEIDHDPQAFTQGLVYRDGFLYESVGGYGTSNVRKVDPRTGRILLQSPFLPANRFGEGLVDWGDKLIQITWRSRVGYIYDIETLAKLGEFTFSTWNGQGWGLTTDGTHLIVTDGSDHVHFWDPEDFSEVRRVVVTDPSNLLPTGDRVRYLNELEFYNGHILANIWHKDYVVAINPNSGVIENIIDFQRLYPEKPTNNREAVLNGIAFNQDANEFFVTGKLWPKMFKVIFK